MSLQRNFLYFLLVSFLLLFVSIVYISEANVRSSLLGFLIINFIGAIFYILVLRKTEDYMYMLLFYFTFFLSYIVKAVVQYFSGIDSLYVSYTLGTSISMDAYLESLYIVTQGNFIILITLLLLSFCFNSKPHQKIQVAIEKANSLRLVLPLIYTYIFFSSLIMFNYGVAVMGSTEEVELPFKLSGILFYSRTVLLPLFLLYYLQIAMINNDRKFYLRILKTLLFLAISEMIVRATKSPLVILGIQLATMYLLIRISGFNTEFKINSKYFLFFLPLIILLMWPLIGLYRILMVENIDFSNIYNMYTNNYIDQSYFLNAIEQIFNRLLGFLQFAEIVQNSLFNGYSHSIDELLSYDSVARYYTQSYLNLTQKGHLSSPSMLGTALILGGAYWPYVLILFIIITFSVWRSSKLIKDMSIPIKCFLGYYIINFIIAGTVDFFIYDAMLVLVFSWFIHITIQISNKRFVL